jgi:hypothetical protein
MDKLKEAIAYLDETHCLFQEIQDLRAQVPCPIGLREMAGELFYMVVRPILLRASLLGERIQRQRLASAFFRDPSQCVFHPAEEPGRGFLGDFKNMTKAESRT